MRRFVWLLGLIACGSDPRSADVPDASGVDASVDAGASDSGVTELDREGLVIFERLAGLWSGPATRTPLGDFRVMNVDLRPASDQFLFGRVDLDEDNALRFGLLVETHGGEVVTYRNGGYFLGLLRDDRTELVEHDVAEDRFRFCHVDRGCDYIDAVYDFEGADRLIFDVMVRGAPHVYWDARRIEARPIPSGFVDGLVAQGSSGPFPPLPELTVQVRWNGALTAEAPVWIVLSTEGCTPASCKISRHLRALAPIGSTSIALRLAQVHAGPYSLLAVLDRNGTLEASGVPDSGDGVSLPAAITIALPQTEASAPIVYDLP
jgi:hypothetical protein